MKMFPVFEIAGAADSTYPERRMANVVFLWHMHQPYYVDPTTQTATMPWVRLHSVKGYLDMVMLIEEFPDIRVNFNLTPVLMLQIKELVQEQIRDLWLDWSRQPAASLEEHEKFALLENFFKIHRESLVKPFPRYWELLNKRGLTFYRDDVRRGLRYFSTQEFLDLQTWFNLAWCGYSAMRLFPELAELRRKGRNFTEAEKQARSRNPPGNHGPHHPQIPRGRGTRAGRTDDHTIFPSHTAARVPQRLRRTLSARTANSPLASTGPRMRLLT